MPAALQISANAPGFAQSSKPQSPLMLKAGEAL